MTKLTRQEELFLIDLGLRELIRRSIEKPTVKKTVVPVPKVKKWTDAQRKKFSQTMKKKWAERKNDLK